MNFEKVLMQAKEGDSDAILEIIEMYKPLLIRSLCGYDRDGRVMGRTGNSSQPDTESDPGRTGFYSKCRRF